MYGEPLDHGEQPLDVVGLEVSGDASSNDATLNTALMSVGGVEARHAAVLASVLAQTAVPRAFGTTEGALPPGTGV